MNYSFKSYAIFYVFALYVELSQIVYKGVDFTLRKISDNWLIQKTQNYVKLLVLTQNYVKLLVLTQNYVKLLVLLYVQWVD